MREKTVERLCDQLAAQCGYEVVRLSQSRATMQTPGIPDRRYRSTRHEIALWFEVKAPGGKLTRQQADFLRAELACGSPCGVGGMPELGALLKDARNPQADIITTGRWQVDKWAAAGYRGECKAA